MDSYDTVDFEGMALANLEPGEIAAARAFKYDAYGAFKSHTEAMFYEQGGPYVEAAYGEKVVTVLYEWLSFSLPAAIYTPDFLCLMESGHLVFVEVKASSKQRHYLIGRYKTRIVASLNPFFRFCIATPVPKAKGDWFIDRIDPNPRLGGYVMHLAEKEHHGR